MVLNKALNTEALIPPLVFRTVDMIGFINREYSAYLWGSGDNLNRVCGWNVKRSFDKNKIRGPRSTGELTPAATQPVDQRHAARAPTRRRRGAARCASSRSEQ
jgi:hypothetical protein